MTHKKWQYILMKCRDNQAFRAAFHRVELQRWYLPSPANDSGCRKTNFEIDEFGQIEQPTES
jgi:hypothetical protein